MSTTRPSLNVSAISTDWRGVALSNFGLSPFILDGVLFASIEGFIQGIKFPEDDPRRAQAFQSSGIEAKQFSDLADRSGAYWAAVRIPYGSPEHHQLIKRAIRARIKQSAGLRQVLIATDGYTLIHDTGHGPDSPTTSLPATVFCKILTELRSELLANQRIASLSARR